MRSNTFKSALLIAVIIFLLSSNAFSASLSERVHEFSLKNGLKILLMERHTSPTISFSMCFKTGSADEQSSSSGIAHLLEHMLFKGTETIGTRDYGAEKKLLQKIDAAAQALDREKKSGQKASQAGITALAETLLKLQEEHKNLLVENEIDAIYSRNGAEGLNASTGNDVTIYTVSLPANRLELWARIESDRFSNPVFRQFYSERDVVLEELRQSYETKPERMLMTQFLSAAYTAHPYGRPIIGWKSDLQYLSRETCEAFFRKHYSLNNAVISIVGDLQVDEAKKILEKYFGHLPVRPLEEAAITAEPEQAGERRIQVVCNAEPIIIMGYHKPTVPDFADYVFDVIDSLLSGGRTSRLYKHLVLDKKNAVSVETFNGFPGTRYPNLFVIKALPAKSATYDDVEKSVCSQIEALKHGEISQEELDKIKKQLKTDFIHKLQSNAELAGFLSYYATVCNDWRYLEKHLETIDRITAADVQSVARQYLIDKNKTVAYLVKEKN